MNYGIIYINTDYKNLSEFSSSHNFAIKPSKSNVMLLSRYRVKGILEINIGNQKFPFSEWFKILGVMLDEKLRFTGHVSNLT